MLYVLQSLSSSNAPAGLRGSRRGGGGLLQLRGILGSSPVQCFCVTWALISGTPRPARPVGSVCSVSQTPQAVQRCGPLLRLVEDGSHFHFPYRSNPEVQCPMCRTVFRCIIVGSSSAGLESRGGRLSSDTVSLSSSPGWEDDTGASRLSVQAMRARAASCSSCELGSRWPDSSPESFRLASSFTARSRQQHRLPRTLGGHTANRPEDAVEC